MNRRDFLCATGALAGSLAFSPNLMAAEGTPAKLARRLPRWRGFNLLEKFTKREGGNPPFAEADFQMMADWGFDFARLPMSYLCWVGNDWMDIREEELKHIDQAVEFGRQYGVHVNLNFHRAPGYCVNPPKEALDLWTDEKALAVCAYHWGYFAKRY